MKDVCINCHNEKYVDNFYIQYDSLIDLYNEKFARPGLALMALAKPLLKRENGPARSRPTMAIGNVKTAHPPFSGHAFRGSKQGQRARASRARGNPAYSAGSAPGYSQAGMSKP